MTDRLDPESVVFAAVGVNAGSRCNVPPANGLVLGVGNKELLSRVKQHTRDVVHVTTDSVRFPHLGVVNTPQLDLLG